MVYQQVEFTDFRDAFRSYGRENNFSYLGAEVLFDFLEELSNDTGEDIELDVIALCCEYQEMTEQEVLGSYNIDRSKYDSVDEYLQDNTCLCGTFTNDNNETVYVFQAF